MRAILISIQPQWVAKILNGEKTLEIRKTMPKCDLPIDVYIYCTKEDSLIKLKTGYVHDRYVCEKDFKIGDFPKMYSGYEGKGKVVAKFTLNKVEEIFTIGMYYHETKTLDKNELPRLGCLSRKDLDNYLQGENGYAWHIDNLEIFDKPKELGEFKHLVKYSCLTCPYNQGEEITNKCAFCEEIKSLARPFQSWGYIEV